MEILRHHTAFRSGSIGSYFFVAGTRGWHGIVMVSAIYLIVTILGIILMVNLGVKGVEKIKRPFFGAA